MWDFCSEVLILVVEGRIKDPFPLSCPDRDRYLFIYSPFILKREREVYTKVKE